MHFFITEAKVSWTVSYLECVYWTLVFSALFHFLKNWLCVLSVTLVVSNSLWTHGLWPTRLLCPWDFPSKNTGVYCYAHLQGIFLTQGWNPCLLHLLHCRWVLCCWATREAKILLKCIPLPLATLRCYLNIDLPFLKRLWASLGFSIIVSCCCMRKS